MTIGADIRLVCSIGSIEDNNMTAKPSDTIAVKVRMKKKLHLQFQARAKQNGISTNAAIVRHLEQTLIDDMVVNVIKKPRRQPQRKCFN